MNIRALVGNLIPVDFTAKADRKKMKETGDRDPGQNNGGGEEPEQHRFTDQELEEALKFLKANPGIKNNNLFLKVERNQNRITVFVQDPTGKIIRRISDTELWAMVKKNDQTSRGTLLNKAL